MTTRKLIVVSVIAMVALVVIALGGFVVYVNYFSRSAPLLKGNNNVTIGQQLERELRNRAAYDVPASAPVSDDQIARFVTVEEQVESAVGGNAPAFQNACDRLTALDGEPGKLTVARTLWEIGSIGRPFLAAKRAQVDALNAAGFSKAEYEWVRRRLYAAAEIELAQIELVALQSPPNAEDSVTIRRPSPPQVSDDTKRQAARHAPSLQRWRALAFFGL